MAQARVVTARNFVTALIASVGLGIHGASAQPVAASAAGQHLPAYCSASTLNAVEFMKMINAIIARGDLADIPFIEKTLNTKFTVSYGTGLDGNPDPQKLNYHASHVLGSPIHASLRIWKNEPPELAFGGRQFPEVERDYITDCLRIPASKYFSAYFSTHNGLPIYKGFPISPGIPVGNIPPPPRLNAPPEPTEITWSQPEGMPGKNGSKIYLSFSYAALPDDLYNGDNLVDSVFLVQRP